MDRFKIYLLLAAAFIFGFLGVITGTLVSAHGGDSTLIHACVKASNGSLRIISPDGSCGSSETPLDWRIQGEPGPAGPPGPQGPAGSSASASTVLCPVCSLNDANLTGANLPRAFLDDSEMVGTNLTNANLVGANLTNVNLTDADLTDAVLTGSTRTGVIWSNTTCPDGTNSDNNGGTCEGHLTP